MCSRFVLAATSNDVVAFLATSIVNISEKDSHDHDGRTVGVGIVIGVGWCSRLILMIDGRLLVVGFCAFVGSVGHICCVLVRYLSLARSDRMVLSAFAFVGCWVLVS